MTEGAYRASLSTFICSAVTSNSKGHAHACINLHYPSGRRFIVLYVVQMQSKHQSLTQSTHLPSKQGVWWWDKMCRQKTKSRSQGCGKARFLYPDRAVESGHLLYWNTSCLTPWTHRSLEQNHFRFLTQNKDPIIPRGDELNQALSARLRCEGDFWQSSQTRTVSLPRRLLVLTGHRSDPDTPRGFPHKGQFSLWVS